MKKAKSIKGYDGLKRCPFCNGFAGLRDLNFGQGEKYERLCVECYVCEARSRPSSEEEVTRRNWNARHDAR